MTKAQVVATVASPLSPIKIINTTQTIGSFTQDRESGILGVFGEQARHRFQSRSISAALPSPAPITSPLSSIPVSRPLRCCPLCFRRWKIPTAITIPPPTRYAEPSISPDIRPYTSMIGLPQRTTVLPVPPSPWPSLSGLKTCIAISSNYRLFRMYPSRSTNPPADIQRSSTTPGCSRTAYMPETASRWRRPFARIENRSALFA